MYCLHCGVQLADSAKYCSGCGADLAANPPASRKQRDWDLHVSLLAWILMAQAALTAIFGAAIIFAGVVVGRTLTRTPTLVPDDFPPEAVQWILPGAFLIGLLLVAIALPSIFAGVGLLHYRNWGRVLTLVLSFLKVLEVPLGTITAIYAFWVLLSEGGRNFYRRKAVEPEM